MSFDKDEQNYWEEFIMPHLGNDEKNILSEIIAEVKESLEQGDITDGIVDEENLMRFNMANIMALRIFKRINRIRIEPPNSNWSFATSSFFCQGLTIEGGKSIKSIRPDDWRKFEDVVDFLDVSPISETEISITFTVNNVYIGTKI